MSLSGPAGWTAAPVPFTIDVAPGPAAAVVALKVTMPVSDATYPATLTITSLSAATRPGVALASFADGVPVDFTVSAWNGSAGVQQPQVTGNDRVDRWIPLAAPVSTDQVQLSVALDQDAVAGEFTRVAGLDP